MPRLGTYRTISLGGETWRAYLPPPLPPDPPIDLARLVRPLERADQAIGRLDGAASILPDIGTLLYLYVRKEAVVSSQIEGTQSSLSDLLLFELDEAPGAPLDDVQEVSSYVAAIQHGLKRLRGDFPLSLRLLREIHEVLMRSGRGAEKTPGEFRHSQNWIGGTRPGNAIFVPPPHDQLMELLGHFEAFLHDTASDMPVLIKTGLAHVQFETIHPFLDGNARLGRLLMTLMLCSEGVLREPLLYLSVYLKTHRATYYELLQRVRTEGAWEEWLSFFLEGVAETADNAAQAARRAMALFAEDRTALQGIGRAAGTALRIHDHLQRHPVTTVAAAAKALALSPPAVRQAIATCERLGVVSEATGRKRDRVFVYRRYLDVLAEGTEPLERRA